MARRKKRRNPRFSSGEAVTVAGGPETYKVIRRAGSKGGFLGFGEQPQYIVAPVQAPQYTVKVGEHALAPLSNPIYACPACRNPVRPGKRRKLRCNSCGSALVLAG